MSWRHAVAMVSILLVGTSMALPAPNPLATLLAEECTTHPPIVIVGDEGPLGFITGHDDDGQPQYRPGSGVIGGRGTSEDPYHISGWCLLKDPPQAAHILVVGTTSHVKIQNNVIASPLETIDDDPQNFATGPVDTGIHLNHTANVDIVQNVVRGTRGPAIHLEDSTNIRVHRNTVTNFDGNGIVAFRSHGILVDENHLENGGFTGIQATLSYEMTIRNNTLTNTGQSSGTAMALLIAHHVLVDENQFIANAFSGIRLDYESHNNTMRNNTILDHQVDGIRITRSHDNTLIGNRIEEGGDTNTARGGITLDGATRNLVRDNTLSSYGNRGIYVGQSDDNLFLFNRILDNGLDPHGIVDDAGGIVLSESNQNAFTGNHVSGNAVGFILHSGTANRVHRNAIESNVDAGADSRDNSLLDASSNWWGCAAGPGANGCDGIVGNVTYEPWLTVPPADIPV